MYGGSWLDATPVMQECQTMFGCSPYPPCMHMPCPLLPPPQTQVTETGAPFMPPGMPGPTAMRGVSGPAPLTPTGEPADAAAGAWAGPKAARQAAAAQVQAEAAVSAAGARVGGEGGGASVGGSSHLRGEEQVQTGEGGAGVGVEEVGERVMSLALEREGESE